MRHCPSRLRWQWSTARQHKGNKRFWQLRFWEHQLRDAAAFARHVAYIHYNPVSHGLISAPRDWIAFSFHRFVGEGVYPIDWGTEGTVCCWHGVGRE